MSDTNTYDVCLVFTVKALDDDSARDKITKTLARDTRYSWAWIWTTVVNTGKDLQ